MGYCPKCGSVVNQGEAFCRMCGADLSQQNNFQQPISDQFQSGDDSILIDAYIGKNADKIKNGGFSVCTFFFGAMYALYRKMWVVGFAWIFGSFIVNMFIPLVGGFISMGVGIWISIEFNRWYLSNVREQVDSIKKMNSGKSMEELAKICSQKGGTTIVPIIIISLLSFIAIGLLVFIFIVGFLYGFTGYSSASLGDLYYPIPEDFVGSNYNVEDYRGYDSSYFDSGDSCNMTINRVSAFLYDDAKSYLESSISSTDILNDVGVKTINDTTWFYADVQSIYAQEYYYTARKGDFIYRIEFDIKSDDDKKCSAAHNMVSRFMEFE